VVDLPRRVARAADLDLDLFGGDKARLVRVVRQRAADGYLNVVEARDRVWRFAWEVERPGRETWPAAWMLSTRNDR
jgi:hypothetical protein